MPVSRPAARAPNLAAPRPRCADLAAPASRAAAARSSPSPLAVPAPPRRAPSHPARRATPRTTVPFRADRSRRPDRAARAERLRPRGRLRPRRPAAVAERLPAAARGRARRRLGHADRRERGGWPVRAAGGLGRLPAGRRRRRRHRRDRRTRRRGRCSWSFAAAARSARRSDSPKPSSNFPGSRSRAAAGPRWPGSAAERRVATLWLLVVAPDGRETRTIVDRSRSSRSTRASASAPRAKPSWCGRDPRRTQSRVRVARDPGRRSAGRQRLAGPVRRAPR